MIDEAHGAFCYYSQKMMTGALLANADASSISVHKTMGGISGTAMINVNKNSLLSASKVKAAYYLLNTTTSSPVLMSHVESCLISHEHNDVQAKVDAAVDMSIELEEAIKMLTNVTVASFKDYGIKSLQTKIVFKIKGFSGK